MKKINFLLATLLVGVTMTYAQSQVDTFYYDADQLGVDHPSFASYYKITMTSNNPYAPNRYRDFSMDGKLIAEGNFISIDKNSDANSVYDGQCYDYRDNKIGFLYKDGDMIKFTAYDFNNPEIIRYEINLTDGTPNGYENEYDETGELVTSYLYDMGYKINETFSGTSWTYKPHGNSSTLKVSTAPKIKTIRGLYKDHNLIKPNLTNCQEIFLYNDSDKDMLIGLRNIHAVHCTEDGSYIFPMNCAWNGKVIKKVAYNKIKLDLRDIASKIKSQATQNATIVTKTASTSKGTNYTHYNDGKYGTVGSVNDSKDFLKTSSSFSTSSTSTTVDKTLEHQLLKEGEEEYNAIVEERWNNYEKFQELIVDSIYLPAGTYISKVIGFQTNFWYEYVSKDYKRFAECMDPVFLKEHKIFITYDIVDLNTNSVILSVSDMYDAADKETMSAYKKKSYIFIDYYYAGYSSRTKLLFEQSDLYYSDPFNFYKKNVKEDKKDIKRNPQKAELKKQKHYEQVKWIYNRIRATLAL